MAGLGSSFSCKRQSRQWRRPRRGQRIDLLRQLALRLLHLVDVLALVHQLVHAVDAVVVHQDAVEGGAGILRVLGLLGGGGGVEASPLITWGAVIGTPMRLNETEYGHASRMHQPFKVPALPPRDAKLQKLANDAGERLRARTPGGRGKVPGGSATPNLPLARPASSGGKAGTPQLSAAASKMAKSLQKLNGGFTGDSGLRAAYTAQSATPKPPPGSMLRPGSLRGTPKPTPRPTPTPGGGGAAQRRPTANAASARRASSMTGGATPSASAAMGEAAAGSAAGRRCPVHCQCLCGRLHASESPFALREVARSQGRCAGDSREASCISLRVSHLPWILTCRCW